MRVQDQNHTPEGARVCESKAAHPMVCVRVQDRVARPWMHTRVQEQRGTPNVHTDVQHQSCMSMGTCVCESKAIHPMMYARVQDQSYTPMDPHACAVQRGSSGTTHRTEGAGPLRHGAEGEGVKGHVLGLSLPDRCTFIGR